LIRIAPLFIAGVLLLGLLAPARAVPPAAAERDAASSGAGNSGAAAQAAVSASFARLPMQFEANHGQTDASVQSLARGRGYTLFLTPDEAVLALRKPAAADDGPLATAAKKTKLAATKDHASVDDTAATAAVLRMRLVGAKAEPALIGLEELPSKVNYFIGNDPTQWNTDIPTYGKVRYREVYPGVDLVYYGNQGHLEYDFVLAPGADPSVIALTFEGAEALEIDSGGNLVLHTASGDVHQRKPLVYQEMGGTKQEIAGSYVMTGGGRL
jgi:hypothetical protein